jgi:hypothetical protein
VIPLDKTHKRFSEPEDVGRSFVLEADESYIVSSRSSGLRKTVPRLEHTMRQP